MEEFLVFMMAFGAILIPLLFAWAVVNRLANKQTRKPERKLKK